MTLSWAWVEKTLAMTIAIITDKFGQINGHSEAPVSLKRKVKCLKAALKSISNLNPLQESGTILAQRLIKLGGRRNELVHGAMWKTYEGDIQTTGFKVIAGKYAVQERNIDINDAISIKGEICKLSNDMIAFMLEVDRIAELQNRK